MNLLQKNNSHIHVLEECVNATSEDVHNSSLNEITKYYADLWKID